MHLLSRRQLICYPKLLHLPSPVCLSISAQDLYSSHTTLHEYGHTQLSSKVCLKDLTNRLCSGQEYRTVESNEPENINLLF